MYVDDNQKKWEKVYVFAKCLLMEFIISASLVVS